MLSKKSEAFLAVAEMGSFTKAARHLDVSISQVSRRVSQLEDEMEAVLLRRSTRNVSLTEAGEHYLKALDAARGELREAEESLKAAQREPSGHLRVTSTPFMGHRLIKPIVPDLLEDFPELNIQLLFTMETLDLVEERVDVAVRVAPFAAPTSIARRLMNSYMKIMAAPEYLEAHGRPESFAEVDDHRFIMFDVSRQGPTTYQKEARKDDKPSQVEFTPQMSASNLATVYEFILDGEAIGPLPPAMVADDIAAGRLVPLLEGFTAAHLDILAVYQERRFLLPSVRTFIDRLVKYTRSLELDSDATQPENLNDPNDMQSV